ncbi:hypothetical protein Nepgr_033017 [Nepenthes gracilis]|uniref:Uncharacterized protein n=1 Tax=Nepenthes gracilis TaxID=150966 RepID=A0AAD3TL95_NEPGR|nr:hypothetical protein Nepgr_033017 [Nepenthes gracilis]
MYSIVFVAIFSNKTSVNAAEMLTIIDGQLFILSSTRTSEFSPGEILIHHKRTTKIKEIVFEDNLNLFAALIKYELPAITLKPIFGSNTAAALINARFTSNFFITDLKATPTIK